MRFCGVLKAVRDDIAIPLSLHFVSVLEGLVLVMGSQEEARRWVSVLCSPVCGASLLMPLAGLHVEVREEVHCSCRSVIQPPSLECRSSGQHNCSALNSICSVCPLRWPRWTCLPGPRVRKRRQRHLLLSRLKQMKSSLPFAPEHQKYIDYRVVFHPLRCQQKCKKTADRFH